MTTIQTTPGRSAPGVVLSPGGAGAPVDASGLEPVLAPLGRSRTLPAEAYLSAGVLEWEREQFFAQSWVCLGHASRLSRPGDQAAVRVSGSGILLVRGTDGALRGFHNTCRHRAHELLGCGETVSRRVIRCPYHAWAYTLDGRLRAAPDFPLEPDDPVHAGLVPARVAEWRGFLFGNASATAPDLAEHLGNLDEFVAPYTPESLLPAATHRYEVAANWKLIVENYHECYHCSSIHPELCRVTPTNSGIDFRPTGAWVGGTMDLMPFAATMSFDGASHGDPLPGLDGRRLREVLYVAVFPNLLISLHPDYLMTHRVEPIATDRSLIECQWLFPREEVGRAGFDPSYAVDFWDVTNKQDWAACESVQRGVQSPGYRPGPLAPQEGSLYQFLTMVAGGYRHGGVVGPQLPPLRERSS